MQQTAKKITIQFIDKLADRLAEKLLQSSLFTDKLSLLLDEKFNKLASLSDQPNYQNPAFSTKLAALLNEKADEIVHRISLEELLSRSTLDQQAHDFFSGVSDDFWFWLCSEGYEQSTTLRKKIPSLPSEEIQLRYTGSTGKLVLRDGFLAYQIFRDIYERQIGTISECEKILDFGCGWGRIIRFFLKDIEASRLWGVDPSTDIIKLCQTQNPWCQFEAIDSTPPMHFSDNTFNLIYSYSVFSHLSEEVHRGWLMELTRILKPGGLLFITTRGRDFLTRNEEIRKRKDLDAFLASYDAGNYCFTCCSQNEQSHWGETAIPKQYVLKNWTQDLTFMDFIDDRKKSKQNIIVMTK